MPPKRRSHNLGRAKKPIIESDTMFFYLPNQLPYGVFCQWYTSSITVPMTSLGFLIDSSAPAAPIIASNNTASITFTCAEQFYMYCKALFFSDAGTCTCILATSDPKDQKKLGQKVKGFKDGTWARVKSRVARVGNWYKFVQNKDIQDLLLGTGERELAEASRKDRVGGIGFNAIEAEAHRSEWGENLLGKALMVVRKRLKDTLKKEIEGLGVDWEWDGAEDEEEEAEVGEEMAVADQQ